MHISAYTKNLNRQDEYKPEKQGLVYLHQTGVFQYRKYGQVIRIDT
jgi:hypothetical protein